MPPGDDADHRKYCLDWKFFFSENENGRFISILCNNCRFNVFNFSVIDVNFLQFEDKKMY